MRRFDRALYAFFLLALLADVARAHALVPVGGDSAGGLILSAASQLPASSAGKAVLAFGRTGSSSQETARVDRFRLRLSGWSRNFSCFSNPALRVVSANDQDAASHFVPVPVFPPGSPAVAIFEHTISPAP